MAPHAGVCVGVGGSVGGDGGGSGGGVDAGMSGGGGGGGHGGGGGGTPGGPSEGVLLGGVGVDPALAFQRKLLRGGAAPRHPLLPPADAPHSAPPSQQLLADPSLGAKLVMSAAQLSTVMQEAQSGALAALGGSSGWRGSGAGSGSGGGVTGSGWRGSGSSGVAGSSGSGARDGDGGEVRALQAQLAALESQDAALLQEFQEAAEGAERQAAAERMLELQVRSAYMREREREKEREREREREALCVCGTPGCHTL